MPYHHGNLQEVLVDTAFELARTDGPEAVVLRAVSRRAGVSHNAAYRHFEDRSALLTAVCERCMRQLADLMEDRLDALAPAGGAAADVARARLEIAGRAYVEFALREPGWFRTAFAVPPGAPFDSIGSAGRGGRSPYELLGDVLDGMVAAGTLPESRRTGAEYPAWAAVHGLAVLLIEGPLRGLPADERDRALDRVLLSVLEGL